MHVSRPPLALMKNWFNGALFSPAQVTRNCELDARQTGVRTLAVEINGKRRNMGDI